jgi:hypothetical protein
MMSTPSPTRRAAFYAVYLLVLMLVFVGGAELILRAKGIAPWNANSDVVSAIRVEPGGRLFQPHSMLGYTHIPGRFDVTIGIPGAAPDSHDQRRLHSEVTHLPSTLRITRPLASYTARETRPGIWVFGCSWTHGWSVSDNETYPWLLQERFPDYDVVNFGVNGYGEIHSLLQFREALSSQKPPKVAVLAYAEFHDERNTFARIRRKLIAPWNKLGPLVQPYARLDDAGKLRFEVADVEYREFPLMQQLALAHFLEIKYDNYEYARLRSREVTQALMLEMAALARQHDVRFVVATIQGKPMLDFFAAHHISHVDISVDEGRRENTNLPFDAHPSALAHSRFAEKLEPHLRAELGLTQVSASTEKAR